jgi:hypothetical protein
MKKKNIEAGKKRNFLMSFLGRVLASPIHNPRAPQKTVLNAFSIKGNWSEKYRFEAGNPSLNFFFFFF